MLVQNIKKNLCPYMLRVSTTYIQKYKKNRKISLFKRLLLVSIHGIKENTYWDFALKYERIEKKTTDRKNIGRYNAVGHMT